ncbi:MAG: capsular polysaccharide export protein, LipB/KpsS family [Gammaproteobacteria bacterium]
MRQALAASRVGRLGLISHKNFLKGRADWFLTARRGFRACTFDSLPFRSFPSVSFLKSQRASEVVVMRMFDRIYRRISSGQSYEIRKRLYLEQLAWAYGMIVDQEWDVIIFSLVPHVPFAHILHSVATALGRQVFVMLQLPVKDTFIVSRSIERMFDPVRAEYARLRDSGGPVTLSPRLQQEFDRRSGEKHVPFYMSRQGLPWTRRVADWAKWTFRVDTRLRIHRNLRNGFAYWRARKTMPPAGTPFVYFPLHLQPEATTLPMGDVFVDQYWAVEMLAGALPDGWMIVLKEHPVQRMAKRDYGFYERLGRMPQVRLVSRSTDTFRLHEESRAVATITGTAGWEGLLLDKPVIVFGNAFYRGAPGTINVDDPAELRAQLAAIAQGEFPPRKTEDLRRFLAALDRCTEEGVTDRDYLRDSDLTEQQAIERQAAVLQRLISSPETCI